MTSAVPKYISEYRRNNNNNNSGKTATSSPGPSAGAPVRNGWWIVPHHGGDSDVMSTSLTKLENGRQQMEARLKVMYCNQVLVVYINYPLTFDAFVREIRDACKVANFDQLTLKWIDDEGDPCTIATQRELEEAFRLYAVQRDNELSLHVFQGVPPAPGMLCPGEDRESE